MIRAMTRTTTTQLLLAAAFICGTMISVPATAHAQERISADARAHFEAGVSLLQDPDGARYEEAYREFLIAYEHSKSPRVLGNVGLCAMKLERDAEAIEAYSRYIDEVGDIDPVERDQIRRDLLTLKSGVVRITLNVSPPGAKVIDVRVAVRGEPVTNVYTPKGDRGDQITIGVRPGHHVLKAKVGERESAVLEIDAAPGSAFTRSLVVAPPSAPVQVARPSSKALPITMLGFGLASLTAGGVTGYLSMRKVDAIAKQCPNGECPPSYDLERAQRDGRIYTTATDILLVTGGILTVGGFAWLLFSGSGSSSTPAREKPSSSPRASAACTGTGCFGAIGGTF
jgi:hypothetical protein